VAVAAAITKEDRIEARDYSLPEFDGKISSSPQFICCPFGVQR
jgi:hypothetical protein